MDIPSSYEVTIRHADGRPLRLEGPKGLDQPTAIHYLYDNNQAHSEFWKLSNGRAGREGPPDLPAVVIYYPDGNLCQEYYYRGRTGQMARHVIYSNEGLVLEDNDYSWRWKKA